MRTKGKRQELWGLCFIRRIIWLEYTWFLKKLSKTVPNWSPRVIIDRGEAEHTEIKWPDGAVGLILGRKAQGCRKTLPETEEWMPVRPLDIFWKKLSRPVTKWSPRGTYIIEGESFKNLIKEETLDLLVSKVLIRLSKTQFHLFRTQLTDKAHIKMP